MFDLTLKNIIFPAFIDAVKDIAGIIPLLFVIFLIIEVIEYYFFDKLSNFAKRTGYFGPLAGALLASFPQCGFSIIASVMYVRGLITRGTLIAVYISTSDEAIPVLLAAPERYKLVLPVIAIKIILGITAGYLVDFVFPDKKITQLTPQAVESQKGCCEHELIEKDKKDILIHPIKHTVIISLFIFVMTFLLNAVILYAGNAQTLGAHLMINSPIQPVAAAFLGLIPNCAVSVAFILLYIKGSITYASVIAGLCANAGLGIWVIITKNKDKKDSVFIISLLFVISALCGLLISYLMKFVHILSSF